MKVVNKKLTKVLYSTKANPGVHMQVIISSDGLDTAAEIFKESGIEYIGVPAYLPVVDAYITDEIDVVMTDTTEPVIKEVKKTKKVKKGEE